MLRSEKESSRYQTVGVERSWSDEKGGRWRERGREIEKERETERGREKETKESGESYVSWCFEPSQPHRINIRAENKLQFISCYSLNELENIPQKSGERETEK